MPHSQPPLSGKEFIGGGVGSIQEADTKLGKWLDKHLCVTFRGNNQIFYLPVTGLEATVCGFTNLVQCTVLLNSCQGQLEGERKGERKSWNLLFYLERIRVFLGSSFDGEMPLIFMKYLHFNNH